MDNPNVLFSEISVNADQEMLCTDTSKQSKAGTAVL